MITDSNATTKQKQEQYLSFHAFLNPSIVPLGFGGASTVLNPFEQSRGPLFNAMNYKIEEKSEEDKFEDILKIVENKREDRLIFLRRKEEELEKAGYFKAAERLKRCGTFVRKDKTYQIKENIESLKRTSTTCMCGSWMCPVCAPKRALERAKKLKAHAAKMWNVGRHFHMVLTLAHDESCDHLVREIADLLNSMITKFRKKHKEVYNSNILGYIKTFEVTDGRYGFHPHVHFIITMPFDCDPLVFKKKFEEFAKNSIKAFAIKHKREGRIYAKWNNDLNEYDSDKTQKTWFEEIDGDGKSLLEYFNKVAAELSGTSLKSSSMWNMKLEKYAQLLLKFIGFRWTAEAGCWKCKDEKEECDDNEKSLEELILEVASKGWNRLPHNAKRSVQIVMNSVKSRKEFVHYVLDILDTYNLMSFLIYYDDGIPKNVLVTSLKE